MCECTELVCEPISGDFIAILFTYRVMSALNKLFQPIRSSQVVQRVLKISTTGIKSTYQCIFTCQFPALEVPIPVFPVPPSFCVVFPAVLYQSVEEESFPRHALLEHVQSSQLQPDQPEDHTLRNKKNNSTPKDIPEASPNNMDLHINQI